MAYTLPNVMPQDEAMRKGFTGVTDFYNKLVQQNLAKREQKRLDEMQPFNIKHILSQIHNADAANSRAEQLMSPRLQAFADAHLKADPMYEVNQYKALENLIKGEGQPNALQNPMQQMSENNSDNVNGTQNAWDAFQPNVAPKKSGGADFDLLKSNPMLRGFAKKHFGIDFGAPIKENPEQKRAADLQSKIALEKEKTEQKKAQEQLKADLADKKKHKELVDSATNDLPHLEETLRSLNIMKDIAEKDKSLFSHNFMGWGTGDRFAKTTDDPNAGTWQAHGLGPIVSAEKEMSGRGNQLALKAALANKPNFDEHQQVALSKINASIDKIERAIKQTRKIANLGRVVVIDPDGNKFETTAENAKYLPEGWKHG